MSVYLSSSFLFIFVTKWNEKEKDAADFLFIEIRTTRGVAEARQISIPVPSHIQIRLLRPAIDRIAGNIRLLLVIYGRQDICVPFFGWFLLSLRQFQKVIGFCGSGGGGGPRYEKGATWLSLAKLYPMDRPMAHPPPPRIL